jgi:predicted GNAT family acetyltransferase/cell fate (sporulation/competence/biofilm development) regulator YmcA (YheA/YmcA/DUF963 family)
MPHNLDSKVKEFCNYLNTKYESDVRLYITNSGDLKLDNIRVPKEKRKQGIGSAIMNEIVSFADKNGLRLVLTTATKDPYVGTTSSGRLKKFYKRFDFVENKGKDYSISENMFRMPKQPKKLLDQANKLDELGYYKEADRITRVVLAHVNVNEVIEMMKEGEKMAPAIQNLINDMERFRKGFPEDTTNVLEGVKDVAGLKEKIEWFKNFKEITDEQKSYLEAFKKRLSALPEKASIENGVLNIKSVAQNAEEKISEDAAKSKGVANDAAQAKGEPNESPKGEPKGEYGKSTATEETFEDVMKNFYEKIKQGKLGDIIDELLEKLKKLGELGEKCLEFLKSAGAKIIENKNISNIIETIGEFAVGVKAFMTRPILFNLNSAEILGWIFSALEMFKALQYIIRFIETNDSYNRVVSQGDKDLINDFNQQRNGLIAMSLTSLSGAFAYNVQGLKLLMRSPVGRLLPYLIGPGVVANLIGNFYGGENVAAQTNVLGVASIAALGTSSYEQEINKDVNLKKIYETVIKPLEEKGINDKVGSQLINTVNALPLQDYQKQLLLGAGSYYGIELRKQKGLGKSSNEPQKITTTFQKKSNSYFDLAGINPNDYKGEFEQNEKLRAVITKKQKELNKFDIKKYPKGYYPDFWSAYISAFGKWDEQPSQRINNLNSVA